MVDSVSPPLGSTKLHEFAVVALPTCRVVFVSSLDLY